jgi:hypothetical protein
MITKNQVLTILFPFVFLAGCSPGKKATIDTGGFVPPLITPDSISPRTDSLMSVIISGQPFLDSIRKSSFGKDVQVIYTQIDRDSRNKPTFTTYYFNFDPANYFYPASTVKLPTALLALEKVRRLNTTGLLPTSTMITEAGFSGQSAVYNDPSTPDGRPNIAHYVKKILLVSDNDAFNRLYEFLGQANLNTSLHMMGYDSVQIIHRLDIALSEEENRHTNPIALLNTEGKEVYRQPLARSNLKYQPRNTFRGNGYIRKGVVVNEPFNFSTKNRINLNELHGMVQSIMFPEAVPVKQRFRLQDSDLAFVRKYMSMYPSESTYPDYDSSYNNSYVKFLFYGSTDPVEPHIRIFNKVGDAYGFLTDAAYFADFKNGVEFILSATIHCNSDGIYNDNKYDYETVGLPFMRVLGREIYKHELNRTKQRLPDLSSFRFDYKE